MTKPIEEWVRIEGAHEAIVPYYDFQTVQRLVLLDTRISPGNDRLGLFSGLLICGSCGSNMVQKTVTNNRKQYVYYRCVNRKNNCDSPVSICEDILVFQVTKQIDCYISRVRAFLAQASHMSVDNINHELTKGFKAELKEKQLELEKYRHFKGMLNSTLISGIIGEDDCVYMNHIYSERLSILDREMDVISVIIHSCYDNMDERIKWLQSCFLASTEEMINRALITKIAKEICINKKTTISLKFEFEI